MQKQFIILFFLTTLSFSVTIEEEMMLKYGSYISASLLFLVLLIVFLLYWTFHYQKLVKNLSVEVEQREETLSVLQRSIQETELESLKAQHKAEKEIVQLKQNIKALDNSLKEGLKSQIVSKIDEYKAKRTKHLDRVNIKV